MPSYVPHVYGGAGAGALDGPLFAVLRVLASCFAVPVLALLGWPDRPERLAGPARAARRTPMLLIALAVVAAYVLSVANTVAGRPQVYFDTAVMLLVLVTLGR